MRGNTRTRLASSCFLMIFALVILCSFTLVQAATAPVLQSISPDTARVGNYVSLIGTDFGAVQGSSYVSFGPFPAASYVFWTDTEVRCVVPDIPGVPLPVTGPVTVTTPGGTSNAVSFTVLAPNPTVTSIFPPTGLSNSVVDVTITGTGFQNGASVSIARTGPQSGYGNWGVGPVPSNVVVVSATTITCRLTLPGYSTIPFYVENTMAGYSVTVRNPDGGSVTGASFLIFPNPCGAGAIGPLIGFGLVMGMLSFAGTMRMRMHHRQKG
jgi:IPT/TIG domain